MRTLKVHKAALTMCIWVFMALWLPTVGLGQFGDSSKGSEATFPADENRMRAGGRLLEAAWGQYRQGKFLKAADFFRLALQTENPDQKKQAQLGLGYTYLKLRNPERAQSLFEKLWEQGFEPDKTGPALCGLYIDQGRLSAAEKIVANLPDSVKPEMTERLLAARKDAIRAATAAKLKKAWHAIDEKKYSRAEKLFRRITLNASREKKWDATLGLAYALWGQKKTDQALRLFEALLKTGYKNDLVRKETIRLLISVNETERAQALINKIPAAERAPFSKQLEKEKRHRSNQKRAALFKLLSQTEDPAERKALAQSILKLSPGDRGAMNAFGWACRALRDYACASKIFQKLYIQEPTDNHLLGLAQTLVDLQKKKEALDLLNGYAKPLPNAALGLKARLQRELAQELYDRGDYKAAEDMLKPALRISPNDPDLRELRGWIFYKQDRTEEALDIFKKLYEESPTVKNAQAILIALDRTGRLDETWKFIDVLANKDSQPDILHLAAQKYAADGRFITAAQTQSFPEDCFFNCDRPWFEVDPYYLHKKGDEGTSRLSQYVLPAYLHWPVLRGGKITAGITTRVLDAGNSGDQPYVGSFYNSLENPALPIGDFITKRTVWQPLVSYKKEGRIGYRMSLGTTPIGGPIAPLPTFKFQAQEQGNWRFNVTQSSVKQSLLSFIGQEDPYSNLRWGRVVQTAVEAEKSFDLGASYWLTAGAAYGFYWGKQVTENHRLRGSIACGRSDDFGPGHISYGLYGVAEHYDNNQDHYTFGYGGYFSPEIFLIAGPFVSWRNHLCDDYYLDLEASIGYKHYRTAEAPHYRETDPSPLSDPAALNDYLGSYPGEEENGVGVHLQVEGEKLITPHVALGGRVGFETSSNYTLWQGGINIKFYFDHRNALCATPPSSRSDQSIIPPI